MNQTSSRGSDSSVWGVVVAAAILTGAGALGLFLTGAPVRPSVAPIAATPIHHLFFIIKENHAFENYFGNLPGALGYPPKAALPAHFGSKLLVASHPITGSNTSDLPHDRNASMADFDSGRNDGFVAVAAARHYGVPSDAMGYFQAPQIPAYYSYARNFTLADRFFTGVLGPTLPNRIFDFAGTAGNWTSNVPPPPDAIQFPTVFDQFSAAGLRWAYDYSGSPVNLPPLFFPSLNQSAVIASSIRPIGELQRQLLDPSPPVLTYIDPEYDPVYSEHPPANVTLGSYWTSAVVNAIFSSPIASSSAVFLFYDEFGGYWDPIPPPTIGQYGDGFRVPLLVISPWARAGLLLDQQLDPASLLRFVDDNWHLSYLNQRVGTATSVDGAFDFSGQPRTVPLEPTNVSLGSSISLAGHSPSYLPPAASVLSPLRPSEAPELVVGPMAILAIDRTAGTVSVSPRSRGVIAGARANIATPFAAPGWGRWTSRFESLTPGTFSRYD